jgi:hypothetical protein
MYGMSEEMLRALIVRHRDGPASADRVIAAAARYVIELKRGMAAGAACSKNFDLSPASKLTGKFVAWLRRDQAPHIRKKDPGTCSTGVKFRAVDEEASTTCVKQ